MRTRTNFVVNVTAQSAYQFVARPMPIPEKWVETWPDAQLDCPGTAPPLSRISATISLGREARDARHSESDCLRSRPFMYAGIPNRPHRSGDVRLALRRVNRSGPTALESLTNN
jgi:hypothetical protein